VPPPQQMNRITNAWTIKINIETITSDVNKNYLDNSEISFFKLLSKMNVPKGISDEIPAMKALLNGHFRKIQTRITATANSTKSTPCTQPFTITGCGNLKIYFNGMEMKRSTK
jgi:hypothetical protein